MSKSLMERMVSKTSSAYASVLTDSDVFGVNDFISTPIPAMNIALSGSIDGGLYHGLHMISGESKSFKSLFGLIMMKSYMDKYPDSMAIFFDCEFGTNQGYFDALGIDMERVLHIPIHHVEELKFEVVSKLEEIKRGDRVFLFVDSVGNLASKKEVIDAIEQNEKKDMTRAAQLKAFFRIVTPYLNVRQIPMVVIQHVYKEQGSMYPATIVSGGQGGILASNTIWIVTKSQNKEDGELLGFDFKITIDKSRLVKEKSQIPITVLFDGGVSKWSGLFEIAVDGQFITNATRKGYYKRVLTDKKTGEILPDQDWTKKTMLCDEFWEPLLKDEKFLTYIEDTYKVARKDLIQ